MPESKSKRKRKGRRRSRPPAVQTPPRKRRTARWVPYAFFGSMGAGVIIIVLNYMQLIGGEFHNSLLFVGLGLMGVAFAVSTRWY